MDAGSRDLGDPRLGQRHWLRDHQPHVNISLKQGDELRSGEPRVRYAQVAELGLRAKTCSKTVRESAIGPSYIILPIPGKRRAEATTVW